jgi:sec-independent protein translocase protein TatA
MFEGLFQPLHLIIILVIVLIVFGPGKLPQLGEGLGKGIRSFKNAMKEGQDAALDKPEEKA